MIGGVVVLSLVASALAANMNGAYIVASGDRFNVPFNTDYASKGHQYFDIWTPEIATLYGQIFWTDMGTLALPPAIVEQFAGKVIAITGYESDQVIVTPQGQPGVNPSLDFSVPYTWAYNHHYGVTFAGAGTTMKKVKTNPRDPMSHGADWKMVPVTSPEAKARANGYPTSTTFSEGNGGEARKSFHGYPKGYAQMLESPTNWHVTPMQVDTRNRACGVTPADINRCPTFTPGPEPLQARFGLGIPPAGTNYSAIIECPCNSRFGGDPMVYPGTKTKFVSHAYGAVAVGTCGQGKTITNPVDCFNAVASLGIHSTQVTNATVTNASLPEGCSVVTNADNTATVFYNMAKSTQACQVGPKRVGQTSTAVGVTLGLSIVPDVTQVNYSLSPKGVYCSNNRVGMLGNFVSASKSVADMEVALANCEKFCASNAACWGCSVDELVNGICQWNAIPTCGTELTWAGAIPGDIAQKSFGGMVTITASGPADVWFGIGFNAMWMHDQPWTIIVNATSVTERKIGTCGDEGEHCPGDQIAQSVTVVSSQVVGNVRTVVMTRPTTGLTGDHYTFDPVHNNTINIITAVGSSQQFAYHAAHAVGVITMTSDGLPTCVCDVAPVGKLCDINGANCNEFVKDCVPAPDGDLLTQNNPTCNSINYVGGLTGCCAHGRIMLDADQDPGTDLLRYHLKFRFWYEEFVPGNATAGTKDSHIDLPRIYYQTESNAGEYDIPPAFAIPGKPLLGYPNWPEGVPTPGTTCTGTCPDGPDCECQHEITYTWQSAGFRLIYAGGHCHAPACVSMDLYRNDTGELLCRQLPVFGQGDYAVDKFDDAGYITLPPCLWGGADEGLNPSEFLPVGTPLLSVKKVWNKRAGQPPMGHYGDMASWQMRGTYF